MIKNLPRQLLWTDLTDLSEIKSNKLRKLLDGLISIDQTINPSLWSELDTKAMLKLYNEAFYLSTRVVYEQDTEARPETYMKEIMSDLGDENLANYVIFLMFSVLCLLSNKSKEVQQFIDRLQKKYINNESSKLMNGGQKLLKWWTKNAGYRLKPCPYPVDKLQDLCLDWREITQDFPNRSSMNLLTCGKIIMRRAK